MLADKRRLDDVENIFGVRENCINFAAENGWQFAIKREPGESPGQSRCGKSPYRLRQKSHRDSNIRESLPLTSGSGRRAEVETSPKTCRF